MRMILIIGLLVFPLLVGAVEVKDCQISKVDIPNQNKRLLERYFSIRYAIDSKTDACKAMILGISGFISRAVEVFGQSVVNQRLEDLAKYDPLTVVKKNEKKENINLFV